MADSKNRYTLLLEAIFRKYYREGSREVDFDRTDSVSAAEELGITLPKNIGDVLYSFRYRAQPTETITSKAVEGSEWMIRPTGRGRYK
jgi:hypothetical protein